MQQQRNTVASRTAPTAASRHKNSISSGQELFTRQNIVRFRTRNELSRKTLDEYADLMATCGKGDFLVEKTKKDTATVGDRTIHFQLVTICCCNSGKLYEVPGALLKRA